MSLVGFKASNHPQQSVKDDVDDRRTPQQLFEELNAAYRFTVDAAASSANAMLPRYWTRAQDGLSQPWTDERVWANPPYSACRSWVDKADQSMRNGCQLVVMLLPANRCEQNWWQEYIEPYRDGKGFNSHFRIATTFIRGRQRFLWPADKRYPVKGDRPPFGNVLVTWCGLRK